MSTQPPFPELYLRNYLNDEGVIPLELTPLVFTIQQFIVVGSQIDFTLTNLPDEKMAPIVYLNGVPQYPTVNYTINARIISFPEGVLISDDLITVKYIA